MKQNETQQEIQINLVFFAESKYPTAGAPIVGALGLGVAFCFAVLCVLAKNDSHGAWVKRTRRAAMIYSIVALVAMTVCSFGERAGERERKREKDKRRDLDNPSSF